MSGWLADHSFSSVLPLPEYGQLELLEDLGIAQYMKGEQCRETDIIYQNNTHGWTKASFQLELCFNLQYMFNCYLHGILQYFILLKRCFK